MFGGKIFGERLKIGNGALNVDDDTRGGVGDLALEFVLICQVIYKWPKPDTLDDSVNFQPSGNTILCHV